VYKAFSVNNRFIFTMVAFITSVSVVVIAIAVGWLVLYNENDADHANTKFETKTVTSTDSTLKPDDSQTTIDAVIYVIGDLHGDVECARQWVDRTQLIHPSTKQWINSTSHLVFLGDYVDKGIHSKGTIEYVKHLTDTYPKYVTALLGNHEIELLRDRTESIWGGGTAAYYQLPYATTHPGEYLNYLPTDDITEIDYTVVETLYNASIEVYGRGLYRNVVFVPDIKHKGSILHFIENEAQRTIVQDRLLTYQKAYIDAYRTGTVLGTWLEQRPIIKILYGTIFMHGGLSQSSAPHIRTVSDVDHLNQQFNINAMESRLHTFLESTTLGKVVYDLLVYRGNHKDGACSWLPNVLPKGIYRLAVGHTPSSNVRINDCGNHRNNNILASSSSRRMAESQHRIDGYSIFALDSALSRWFRNSGNDYCSGTHTYHSFNQQYTCHKKVDHCQGQIVRITHSSNSNEKDTPPSSIEKENKAAESHRFVQVDILTV
jgi:Calcineurin-like phosphoesterase